MAAIDTLLRTLLDKGGSEPAPDGRVAATMIYVIEIRDKAQRDFGSIPPKDAVRISKRIAALAQDLQGDVKRLTNFVPEYRLRVGDWRVLFEVTDSTVIIHRVMHRREVYR